MDYDITEQDGKKGILYNNYFFPVTNDDDVVQTLFGSMAYIRNCVGYCCNHHRYITEKMLKGKKCLAKQCNRFIRTPFSEDFWDKKDAKKALKKKRKEGME